MSDPPCFRFVLLMESVHRYLICPGRPLFNDLEIFLAYSAQRAHPICRKVFESCSRFDPAVRITYCRIIFISADNANVLFHNIFSVCDSVCHTSLSATFSQSIRAHTASR